jgi:hypothetical protein
MPTRLPKVTVLMPVFNGEAHLREAVESILAQTFTDFEFLVVDDGSTDRSAEIIAAFRDPRIRLLSNDGNHGLIFTLNRGIDLATGKYLARMDCDDISLPERLAHQVAFMESNPEIGICGTWFRKFGTKKDKVVRWQAAPDHIRCGLLFDAMVGHPTVVMRRELLIRHDLHYDPAYKNAEDFELWVRASQYCDLANLDEVLLRYRVHPAQVTQSAASGQRETAGKVRLTQLRRMGIDPSPAEFEIHQAVSTCVSSGVDDVFARGEEWLCRLIDVNDRSGIYPERAFAQVLVERWLTFCKKTVAQGQWSSRAVYFPKLLKKTGLGGGYVARYLFRQLGYD